MSFLFQEWNWDDALAVRYEEGHEDGLEEGREEGLEQGLEQGREEGREERDFAIARNLLAKGLTPEFVHEITGLSLEEIEKLQG